MKKMTFLSLTLALISAAAIAFMACGNDELDHRDMTPPVISDEGITANPINCQVYHRGEIIAFTYVFTDNRGLGSYIIEIHSNFDHHSHSTESGHESECDDDDDPDSDHHDGRNGHHDGDIDNLDEETPWNQHFSFDIPYGLKRMVARNDLKIPDDATPGDYHFMIRLTDESGWQQLKAVAIKILE